MGFYLGWIVGVIQQNTSEPMMQLGISESYVTKIYDACDTVKPQATLDPLRIQVQGGGMSAV